MSGGTADQRAAGAGLCGDSGTGDHPASPKGGRTEDPGHSGPAGEESLLNWTCLLVCGSLSLAVFFFQIFHGHSEVLFLFLWAVLSEVSFQHYDYKNAYSKWHGLKNKIEQLTGTWSQPLKRNYAGIRDMVGLDVQTDGGTYHKWLSASVSVLTPQPDTLSKLIFLHHAFASIMQGRVSGRWIYLAPHYVSSPTCDSDSHHAVPQERGSVLVRSVVLQHVHFVSRLLIHFTVHLHDQDVAPDTVSCP